MNELNLTANLILRKHKEQSALPVRERDWEKIELMVSDINKNASTFPILASLVFGVAFSIVSLLLLIAVGGAEVQSVSMISGNFVVSVIIGIAIALFILARQQRAVMGRAIDRVLNEMDLVQKEFTPVNMATQITEEVKESGASVADQFLK
jgi:ABC-type multidrug transport system fused ATPase/permease subunit